jgi:hypothetical protein
MLNHPNIVKYMSHHITDNGRRISIVLEYVLAKSDQLAWVGY